MHFYDGLTKIPLKTIPKTPLNQENDTQMATPETGISQKLPSVQLDQFLLELGTQELVCNQNCAHKGNSTSPNKDSCVSGKTN